MIRPRKGAAHLFGIGRIKTIRHRLRLPRRIGAVLLDIARTKAANRVKKG